MFDHKELKKIRRHLGFSLKEFAELLDVKYNTYKKIGRAGPPGSVPAKVQDAVLEQATAKRHQVGRKD